MAEDCISDFRRVSHWWWCGPCKFGQVDPMPGDIIEHYSSGAYRKSTHDHRDMGYEYDGEPGEWNYLEEEKRARGWMGYIDLPVLSHLDVGASTGKVLEIIDAKTQVGVELGPWERYYESYPFTKDVEGKFELVTCFHTLEHVIDPIAFMRDIADVHVGQVCVEVPHGIQKGWPHLLAFTDESLLQVMSVAGLAAKIVESTPYIKVKHS